MLLLFFCNLRKYLLKRRQDMMDNDGFVDIQILLTDDFHIQPTNCLTDLICENPIELLQNKRCLRYIQAQHSENFHIFARRLANAMVQKNLFFKNKKLFS